MKRVVAGVHFPTLWLFEPAKRLDDRADYCLDSSFEKSHPPKYCGCKYPQFSVRYTPCGLPLLYLCSTLLEKPVAITVNFNSTFYCYFYRDIFNSVLCP